MLNGEESDVEELMNETTDVMEFGNGPRPRWCGSAAQETNQEAKICSES
jgi:hypothetical protein